MREVLGGGGETKPSAKSSNTIAPWTGMGTNPGLHGEIPAIKCPSYSRVIIIIIFSGSASKSGL
jgi:hypothetical protein